MKIPQQSHTTSIMIALVALAMTSAFASSSSSSQRTTMAFVASSSSGVQSKSVSPLTLLLDQKQPRQRRRSRLFLGERGDQQHKPERPHTRHHDHNNPAIPQQHQQQQSTSWDGSGDSHTSKSSTELASSMSSTMFSNNNDNNDFHVFCDLDGVLVDFEHGVQKLLNRPSSKLVKGTMWKNIARANAFYEHLPWTRDGRILWNSIRKLKPDILTGVPYPKSSRIEKFNWCSRELGLNQNELHHCDMAAGARFHESVNGNHPLPGVTNIITCWSNNKHLECNTSRAVLIDDRDSARETWEQAGGIFIHHVDAQTTLQQLREYGILVEEEYPMIE